MNINYNNFWKIYRSPYNNRLTQTYKEELTAVHPRLIRMFEQGDHLIKHKHSLDGRTLEEESITIRTNINIMISEWLQTKPKHTKNIKRAYDNLMGELKLFNRE